MAALEASLAAAQPAAPAKKKRKPAAKSKAKAA
jgi:hypothetical protein